MANQFGSMTKAIFKTAREKTVALIPSKKHWVANTNDFSREAYSNNFRNEPLYDPSPRTIPTTEF
jgi:hypothetical protein